MYSTLASLLAFIFVINFSCSQQRVICPSQNNEPKDTCIAIVDDYFLVLQQNISQQTLIYTNPRVRYNNEFYKLLLNINTTQIEQFDFSVSPNKKYVVMHYVANDGFVFMNENDSIYHEVFKSSMVNLKTGNVLVEELTPLESLGHWNNINKWVDDSGRTLISPENL